MGHVDIFKYFFERVEVKNSQDDYGQMPIHWAAGNGNLEICKYIHEKGDCLCTQVNDGTMPIHLAAMSGNLGAKYLGFAPLIPSKREKNVLVLLS